MRIGPAGDEADDLLLRRIRVLILIDEDVAEAVPQLVADVLVLAQQAQQIEQQVVKIHAVALALALGVGLKDLPDELLAGFKLRVILQQHVEPVALGIGGEAMQSEEQLGLREAAVSALLRGVLADEGAHERLLIVAIHDGEAGPVAEHLGVAAQQAVGDGVEGAAPEAVGGGAGELLDALEHLAGGLVGEGQQQDAPGGDALIQQPGDAVGQRARLAAAGAGDDERMPLRRRHGGILLGVQLGGVVARAARLNSHGVLHHSKSR